MEPFVLASTKFDKLDSMLSMIVTDQVQSQRSWVVFDVMKFITAFPNVKFTRTLQASSTVNAVIRMLTPEQRDMLKKDKNDDYCIPLSLQGGLLEAMIDLMHSVVQSNPAACNTECMKVDQALVLSNLCLKLASDLVFPCDSINTLEQARQNVITYRAAVIRKYDELYPGQDPYAMSVPNTTF